MPRFDADWIDSMLQPERRGAELPHETVARIGLNAGQVVADVGCGPGFFTLPAARAVAPSGLVYAIDREPRMLEVIRARAEEAQVTNLVMSQAEDAIPLADASVDLALCALVIHDLAEPDTLIRELVRITRPNGRIAIVEWLPDPNETRPNRISPDQLVGWFNRVGRVDSDIAAIGPRQYLAIF